MLPHIFEPFFIIKDIGKGTVLGLSQVFGFAKQSGGDVDVSSISGRGTNFTLYLPEVEGASETASPDPRDERIVEDGSLCRHVVEDNVEVDRFATQILEDLGHRTV